MLEDLMSDLKTSNTTGGSLGGLIVAIAGALISILLWIAKINPSSDVVTRLNLPPDVTTGWSGLAIVAALCGGVALLFAVVRGITSGRGLVGLTVVVAVIALSYPAGIVLGAVAPDKPGPLQVVGIHPL
jgi:hypothetical protein